MKKILFVCLGNICRSPLARGIMQHKIGQHKLDAFADSAGFEDYHIGEPADPRSIEIARINGVSLNGHSARQFQVQDFDRFDKIYVMDHNNYRDVASLARNEADLGKVDYIMNTLEPGSNKIVPDPYYGGRDGFRQVYDMLDRACDVILNNLQNKR